MAEIKLMVKTTELGKEAVEIRSIREFVETEVETEKSEQRLLSPCPRQMHEEIVQTGDSLFSLHRSPSPSPKFVREQDLGSPQYQSEDSSDEFNLMSHVRGRPMVACFP